MFCDKNKETMKKKSKTNESIQGVVLLCKIDTKNWKLSNQNKKPIRKTDSKESNYNDSKRLNMKLFIFIVDW